MAVIEKGKTPGAHLLSGANMRPSAMRELFPDMAESEWPVLWKVEKDAVYLLTEKQALPLKPMPPNFRNHGNYVVSVAQLGRFLAEQGRGGGRLHPVRDRRPTSCWSRTASSSACAPATRAAAGTASRSRTSSPAPT